MQLVEFEIFLKTIFLTYSVVIYSRKMFWTSVKRKGDFVETDFLLIHKMKNGDEAAMELFVRKYYPVIRSYCRCHTYVDEIAEDLTQETFEHFFKSFKSYHHSGKLINYLYTIAGNLCRNSYKKKQDLLLDELPETGETSLEGVELRMDIETAVRRLPEEMKEVIILYYFQNLKVREMAEIIGIGVPLAKYRLKKAKELLRILIGEAV